MKKLIGIMLIVTLLLSMLGCNSESVPRDPTNTGKPGTLQTGPSQPTTESVPEETYPPFDYDPVIYQNDFTIPETGLNASVQYLPEMVENPENLPVLKWVCIAQGKRTWTEEAVHELNRMLADRNMPYRVQFAMLTGDVDLYAAWFSQPEAQELLKDADLIWAFMSPENQKEYLMPITEYVSGDAQSTLKNAVVHDLLWTRGMVDGEIYGIPTYPTTSGSHGWVVKPEVLTKYGLTEEDFQRNYWEMDEVFAKIYAANDKQPFLHNEYEGYSRISSAPGVVETLPGTLSRKIENLQQNVGLTFGIDVSSGVPTVVNFLESDTTRLIHEAIIRYKDAGYITTSQEDVEISYGITYGTRKYSFLGATQIPVTNNLFDCGYAISDMSGIAAVSQHKEEAVSLLNLIAEDEQFRHQLLFGKEGRDYTLTEGNYSEIKQNDGAYYNMEFLSMYSVFDSVREKDVWPFSYEGKTKLETYLECMDSVSFCCYPITFDYSGLETELEEYARVYGDYCRYLTNNKVDIDDEGNELPYKKEKMVIDGIIHEKKVPRMDREAYDEMLQKLNDAGAQKIIAELQRQLDEWLEKNPDWKNRYTAE